MGVNAYRNNGKLVQLEKHGYSTGEGIIHFSFSASFEALASDFGI